MRKLSLPFRGGGGAAAGGVAWKRSGFKPPLSGEVAAQPPVGSHGSGLDLSLPFQGKWRRSRRWGHVEAVWI